MKDRIELSFDEWDAKLNNQNVGSVFDVFKAGYESNKGFEQGVCLILSEIIKKFDEPTISLDIMKSLGYTIEDFNTSGCDKKDLDVIKNEIRKTSKESQNER